MQQKYCNCAKILDKQLNYLYNGNNNNKGGAIWIKN